MGGSKIYTFHDVIYTIDGFVFNVHTCDMTSNPLMHEVKHQKWQIGKLSLRLNKKKSFSTKIFSIQKCNIV